MISLNENDNSVDVIIPVYNGAKFILRAIESVEAQTVRPNKLIIVDDGSTDDTEKVVLEYKKNSSLNIQYIKKDNAGPNSARNAGLAVCETPFVAFLDSDDEWCTNKLQKQLEVFGNSTLNNLGVVYCAYALIDDSGNKTEGVFVELDKKMRGIIFEKLILGNKIVSSASGVLIKRKCFEKSGNFDESLRAYEDWDMWLRLAEHFEFDYVDEILVKIRRHPNNAQRNNQLMFVNGINFYNKWILRLDKKLIPKKWRDDVVFLTFMNRIGILNALRKTRNLLSEKAYTIFFKSYICIELYAIVFLWKALIWGVTSPNKFKRFIRKVIKNKNV